jgi:predicted amidohydrolase
VHTNLRRSARRKTNPPSHERPYVAPPPSQAARDDYLDARIRRRPIQGQYKKSLRDVSMICDPEITHSRLTGEYERHDSPPGDHSSLGLTGRLRIAAVGFRVKISRLTNQGYLNEDLAVCDTISRGIVGLPDSDELAQLGRSVRLPFTGEDKWAGTIEAHVERALARGSHVVLLPEFALPSATARAIEKRLCQACDRVNQEQDHFVFAGSRHEGAYNRGLIVSKRDNAVRDAWHYKLASAKALGENILGPHGDQFPSYSLRLTLAHGGYAQIEIMVAICYDAFDPTTFLNLVLSSASHERNYQERIILVPSFNHSREFVELLRDLSFLAECPVVYVNGLHGDARMFICGFDVCDIRQQQSVALVERLNETVRDLEGRLFEENERYRRECASDPSYTRSPEQREEVASWKHRVEELKTLREHVSILLAAGALDRIITVEGCNACIRQSHLDDYNCPADILYYNIDMGLIHALADFRRKYFKAELLPKPFHAANLEEAARKMEKIRRRRIATRASPK